MNELEKTIISELAKINDADDAISNSAKGYCKAPKPKGSKLRKIMATGASIGILYCTYAICHELTQSDEQKTLAIPVAIIGISAAGYVKKKVSNKQ